MGTVVPGCQVVHVHHDDEYVQALAEQLVQSEDPPTVISLAIVDITPVMLSCATRANGDAPDPA